MALSFNAQVTCGSTKAEVLVNNPNWFDILDVSVVNGFNEKIQVNLTPTGGSTTQLGPPVGKLGNQKVFGVFPYGCTICAGIKNAPCGDNGGGECKSGLGVQDRCSMSVPNERAHRPGGGLAAAEVDSQAPDGT